MSSFVTILVLIACVLYFSWSFDLAGPLSGMDREELGQFGDSWGFLTSVFSALAFIGVLFNNGMQRKSLKQATKISIEQATFIRHQQFEASLFQMMGLLQEILKDIDISGTSHRTGRDCFKVFYEIDLRKAYYSSLIRKRKLNNDPMFIGFYKLNMGQVFNQVYYKRQQDLGHYFRFLYNVFKFISESELDAKYKRKYANLVRAQLSNYELLMLFYNCMSTHGGNFEKYAIEFSLFDNMPLSELLNKRHFILIDRKAFKV